MKIYFAGSIRSGRQDVDIYLRLIEYLKTFGCVLTEHVGAPTFYRFKRLEIQASEPGFLPTGQTPIIAWRNGSMNGTAPPWRNPPLNR